jgi:hypothetical protein
MDNNKDRIAGLVITVVTIWATVLAVVYLPNLGILVDSWQALLIAVIFIALGSFAWVIYKRSQQKRTTKLS